MKKKQQGGKKKRQEGDAELQVEQGASFENTGPLQGTLLRASVCEAVAPTSRKQ